MPEPIVTFNEESLKTDLRELVRSTVEEMLNGLLDEEADDLVGAERYERTAGREAYRAGHYERKLTTTSGEGHDPHAQAQGHAVHHGDHRALPAPRDERRGGHDRDVPRGRLHQAHRGRLRDPLGLERLGVDRLQPQREGVRVGRGVAQQPLDRAYPYVYVDGIYLKRSWGGSYENVAVMVAIGVNDDGFREVIGAAEGFTESAECWREFPLVAEVARAARGQNVHRGQGRRHGGIHRRGLPGGGLPAMHGPLDRVLERAREGAQVQAA